MDVEVLLATAAAVVSLYAALFHAWVFGLHRRAVDHGWVAVAAAGACLVSCGTALLYRASTQDELLHAQRVQGIGVPIVMLGALLFTLVRFEIRAPRLARAAIGSAAVIFLLALFAPELLFQPERGLAFANQATARGRIALSALGTATLAVVLAFFVMPVILCVRAWRRGHPAAPPLLVCFAGWTAAGLSDTAVGIGLYHHPFLMPTGGYMLTSVALSSLLLRDLATVMEDSERRSGRLQDAARDRADALRAVDLRLARGEQLAAIGTLAAGVAHEINNPLAYVSANLNQLRAMLDDDSSRDEVEEILAECREGLARVGAIVTDLLRMGRQGESEREQCDLGDVVRDLLPLLVREAGPEVELVTDLQSRLPVFGHPRLLRQAVLNLVLNALQATRASGRGAPRIAISAWAEHERAVVCVRDNGPGIPPELRARVFEPSFTTKPDGGGSGIGLALTRLVVTRHGGAIDVESDGDGTAVVIRLPLGARTEP